MKNFTDLEIIEYKEIAESIQNADVPDLLLGILEKQKTILDGIKNILNEEQSTYVHLFNRYYSIFNEIIHVNKCEDASKAVLNILQRPAIEISLVLQYLLVPGYFPGSSEDDERKFKLDLYMYCGYKQKQKEFKKLKENGFNNEEQHKVIIQDKIDHYKEQVCSSIVYRLCDEKIRSKAKEGQKFFLKKDEILSYSEMVRQAYVNQFMGIQYQYLSAYIHCGYESIIFEKIAENNKDERLLILYLTCASIFLTVRYYFKVDFDNFTKNEIAIILDFISIMQNNDIR